MQIVWKNEEGGGGWGVFSGGWGDKFVHREFLLSIRSTYWPEVGVMGDILGSPLFFTCFILTIDSSYSSISLLLHPCCLLEVLLKQFGINLSSRTREVFISDGFLPNKNMDCLNYIVFQLILNDCLSSPIYLPMQS